MTKTAQAVRSENINLRIAPALRELIDRAAGLARKTRTGYILETVTREAENDLLDQRVFEMSPERLRALRAAMDAPPRPSEALRALMARKPEWER